MSAATISPVHVPAGATPLTGAHRHRLGDALRAVRVFVRAAFDVAVLGEYGEEAGVGVRRRPSQRGATPPPPAARPRP